MVQETLHRAETMEAALLDRAEGPAAQPQVSSLAAADCQVYWPAPYEVCGAIRDKYNELGGRTASYCFRHRTN